jgi:DNA modification methylase
MAGTGTTGYTAKMFKRNFTMIERKPEYVEAIVKRVYMV